MGNWLKIVKYVAAIIGWVWAIIQYITAHPFPPFIR